MKISSNRENEFMLALVRKELKMAQFWMGLQWIGDRFYWSDSSYRAPGEPNGKAAEPCSFMWTGTANILPNRAAGYWNDEPCHLNPTFRNGIVCKRLP